MQIIPVVDLKNSQVVQAVRGQRESYQAIRSQLCASSCPFDIIPALLDASGSDTLYIADLDAISGHHDQLALIEQLAQLYPDHNFWIDAGFKHKQALQRWSRIRNMKAVIGSESHQQISTLLPLLHQQTILSLDFNQQQLLGPAEILTCADQWPDQVIVMSLDAVGDQAGPNRRCLESIRKLNSASQLFAAGGIRDQHDLDQLQDLQISGALIATALHQQMIRKVK